MLERLKRALVESFVGAIALGWLFAQAIGHLANILAAPVASWISRKEYQGVLKGASIGTAFSMQDGLPELIRFVGLMVVGYLLLRWLYIERPPKESPVRTEASLR